MHLTFGNKAQTAVEVYGISSLAELFSSVPALGQLPSLYEATPDYHVIIQITSYAIAGPKKKIHINDSSLSYEMLTNLAVLKIVLSAVCCSIKQRPIKAIHFKNPKKSGSRSIEALPHKGQNVSVNIGTLTPLTLH